MGRLRTTAGFLERQRNQHRSFFSSIHRAQVTDAASVLTKGTVNALIENTDLVISVLAPLVALSLPPKGRNADNTLNNDDDNGAKTSWGRYIPQVGDMLIIGFDTNGEPYALGYHATYFQAMEVKDQDAEDRGGIGWGEVSGIDLEGGDWDFKARRGGRVVLTDKAQLSSGASMLILDQAGGEAVLNSTLVRTAYGEASEERQGAVKRLILATDSEETDIPGIFGSTAQESTNVVSRGSLTGPIEMARTSMGEVIDETTYLPMVPLTSYSDLSEMKGTGTRLFRSVKDFSGASELYSELVDDLGNYGVSASTSLAFQWFTPASTWSILNAITDWQSSGSFSITTLGDFGIDALNATISAQQVALGGSTATSFLIKGTEFMSAFKVFLTALGALSGGSPAQNAAAVTAIVAAANVLSGALSNVLSTVTKTV